MAAKWNQLSADSQKERYADVKQQQKQQQQQPKQQPQKQQQQQQQSQEQLSKRPAAVATTASAQSKSLPVVASSNSVSGRVKALAQNLQLSASQMSGVHNPLRNSNSNSNSNNIRSNPVASPVAAAKSPVRTVVSPRAGMKPQQQQHIFSELIECVDSDDENVNHDNITLTSNNANSNTKTAQVLQHANMSRPAPVHRRGNSKSSNNNSRLAFRNLQEI
jgi:hypothetical protein